MHIGVIVAEYNPFHNGHAYHIKQTRQAGATHVAIVMSGNFVQRGEPALFEKRVRTRAALECGADLVLELPLPFAMAGAQRFARGAVALAHAIGCCGFLSFGSECGDLSLLSQAAGAVKDPAILHRTKELMCQGLSFAQARQQAVQACYGNHIAELLASPNNLLGIEYLLALQELKTPLTAFTLPRIGPQHDSTAPISHFAPASYLRKALLEGQEHVLEAYVPEPARCLFERELQNGPGPALVKNGERSLLCAFRSAPLQAYQRLPDLSEGLENRMYKALRTASSFEEALEQCKAKRYPTARLRRAAYSLFLGLEEGPGQEPPPYLRVLGFNRRGQELLGVMKTTASLPVSDSLAKLVKLGEGCAHFAALEAHSCDLYTLFERSPRPCGWDYIQNAVRLLEK